MLSLADATGDPVLGVIIGEHLRTGGKRLRARLALAACEAFGGQTEAAIPWAAACEMFHNGTLLHDDLQDGDRVRRGAPTAWVTHGAGQAINAGDLMLLLPYLAVGQVDGDDSLRHRLAMVLARLAADVIRGQGAELELARTRNTSRDAYRAAIEGKTAALFVLPAQGGAEIAGRLTDPMMLQPFFELGVMFQLQDDVLDLFGDKGRGEVGSDLREGKTSALVVEHLELHPAARDGLIELLSLPRDQTPMDRIESTIAQFRDGGALEGVVATIRELGDSVRSAPVATSEPAVGMLLGGLTDLILEPIAHVC